eukprot:jgi/Mesvir1/7891/Mv11823-RA.1
MSSCVLNILNFQQPHKIINETGEHFGAIREILDSVQQGGREFADAPAPDAAGVLIHHQCLLRNKRALLAYANHRMHNIKAMRFSVGAMIPAHILPNLSPQERDFYLGYDRLLGDYIRDVGTDITLDQAPPKDPYLEILVLEDQGEIMVNEERISLVKDSVHLLRRADVEHLIMQGVVEPVSHKR